MTNSETLDTYIKDALSGRSLSALPDAYLLNLRSHLDGWAAEKIICLNSGNDDPITIRSVCAKAGLSDAFVSMVLSEFEGAFHEWRGRLDLSDVITSPMSHRVTEIIATAKYGGKPAMCPFTGEGVFLRDTIGLHTFLHRKDGQTCIFISDCRIDQPVSDRIWYFPDHGFILSSVPDFDSRFFLVNDLSLILPNIEEVDEYLKDPRRTLMISEDANGHIGHYIWNIVSGWSFIFSKIPPEKITTITSWHHWQIFGGVTRLYADRIPESTIVLRPRSNEEIFRTMLATRAISTLVRDQYISDDLAARLISQSWEECSDTFRETATLFRENSLPLLMITIRTENRQWIEQEQGYIEIIRDLKRTYPQLGVVIDGLNSNMDQVGSHGWMSIDTEKEIAAAIMKSCPDVQFLNLIGCSPAESVTIATRIDAFIAPVGAGLAKTRWVVSKPGVVFSNERFMQPGNYDGYLYDRFRISSVKMRYVSQLDVTDVEGDHNDDGRRANFSMDWQAPLSIIKEILDDIYRDHNAVS